MQCRRWGSPWRTHSCLLFVLLISCTGRSGLSLRRHSPRVLDRAEDGDPGRGVSCGTLVALLHAVGEAPLGLLPMRLYLLGTVAALVGLPLAAVAGARFYREPA